MDNVVGTAAVLARTAHEGQMRRDGVTPYMNHVMDVVLRVKDKITDNPLRTIALATAYLHDVVEDTNTSLDDLRHAGFPAEVVDAVDALTKRKGEAYMDAVARAKANPVARLVKIADNLSNLSDSPTDRQILKYATSLQFLLT